MYLYIVSDKQDKLTIVFAQEQQASYICKFLDLSSYSIVNICWCWHSNKSIISAPYFMIPKCTA